MAEALRLADELDDIHTTHVARNAAAELRRLSAVEAQRDALLEALRQIVEQHGQWNNGIWAANIARAAIKAVEENT